MSFVFSAVLLGLFVLFAVIQEHQQIRWIADLTQPSPGGMRIQKRGSEEWSRKNKGQYAGISRAARSLD